MVLDALKPKSRKKGGAKTADQTSTEPAAVSGQSDAATLGQTSAPLADTTAAASPAAPASIAGGDSADRIKGPVEEVISKRARQLAKKIQRFKGYAASTNTLNADQKAAIATLPALEAVYNELQELIKPGGPVEVAELNEAAKVRDLQKNQSTQVSSSAASSSASASALADPLSRFLRLYGLLHPARPSDHTNLTFGRIQLPSNMEDQVQATDILRVGRMWEDLRAGGEAGAAVLEGLARGPTGEDEENDHVHHLLVLVSESAPLADTDAPLAQGSNDAAAPTEVIAPSGLDNADEHPVPAEGSAPAPGAGGVINFLQQDEVNARTQPELDTEHSFEIVPPMDPHQTSGQQPPVDFETAPVATVPAAAAAEDFNWAEDEDEHHVSQTVPAEEQLQGDAAAIELAQPVETGDLATAQPTGDQVPSAAQETLVTDGPVSGAQPTATAIMSGQVSAPQPGQKADGSGSRKPRQPQQPQPKNLPRTMVDEDGFEMKVRNRAPSHQQGQNGGRGGRGGARGGAGGDRGARGAGRGGPGGANRGSSNRVPRPAQGAAAGVTETGAAQATQRPPRTGNSQSNGQRGGRAGAARQGQNGQRASQAAAAAAAAAVPADSTNA